MVQENTACSEKKLYLIHVICIGHSHRKDMMVNVWDIHINLIYNPLKVHRKPFIIQKMVQLGFSLDVCVRVVVVDQSSRILTI